MPEFDSDSYITSSQLGEIIGVTDTEVARLSRAGILPRTPRLDNPRAYDYPLVACLKAYIRHRNSKASRDRETYFAHKARSEWQRALKLKIENERNQNRFVDLRLVMQQLRSQHSQVRQRLLQLPVRLARQLPGDPVANEVLLTQEVPDIFCLSGCFSKPLAVV
jgi:hypothetical protein